MNQTGNIFLETADYLGAKLCRDAVWSGNRCNWLGDSMEPIDGSWIVVHRAFGPEFYNGTSGIAYFLSHLFQATNERIFSLTADAAMRQALSRTEDISERARGAFYTGLVGVAFAAIKVGEILDNSSFVDKGIKILKEQASDDPAVGGLDIISGSAGTIPALLNINKKYPNDFLVQQAIKHGEHLIATARKANIGWSWNALNNPPGQHDLCGFSHGSAGIAWALLELYKHTNEQKFRAAAEQGFYYERHWFSAEQENWPDLRVFGPQQTTQRPSNFMSAWCHGAPGIGLSRIRAFQLTGDQPYRAEAEAALRTTIKILPPSPYAGQNNYSLCHGNGGNADLLIYASTVFDNKEYKQAAEQVGLQGYELYRKTNFPWPCGVNGGGEAPNLMLGLAGIGYFYLRLVDPVKIPSVLIVLPDA